MIVLITYTDGTQDVKEVLSVDDVSLTGVVEIKVLRAREAA